MKAGIIKKWNAIELDEMKLPSLRSDETLVKVEYAGLCNSDLKILGGKHKTAKCPIIPGHEISGIVEKTNYEESGKKKNAIAVGDKVAIWPVISCGKCKPCIEGRENVCEKLKVIGIHENGGFGQYVKIPTNVAFKLPEEISTRIGSLAELVADALHHIRRSKFKEGSKVIVVGEEPVGIVIATLCKIMGADEALLIGENFHYQNIANTLDIKMYCCNEIESGEDFDFGVELKDFDIGFDCSGLAAGNSIVIDALASGGELIFVGLPTREVALDMQKIFAKELSLVGCRLHTRKDFEDSIEIMKEEYIKQVLEEIITKEFPLDEIKESFDFALSSEPYCKIIIKIK